jgi:hypothetical protein
MKMSDKNGLYISWDIARINQYTHIYIEGEGSTGGEACLQDTFACSVDLCEEDEQYLFDSGPYVRVTPLELVKWSD